MQFELRCIMAITSFNESNVEDNKDTSMPKESDLNITKFKVTI